MTKYIFCNTRNIGGSTNAALYKLSANGGALVVVSKHSKNDRIEVVEERQFPSRRKATAYRESLWAEDFARM